MTIFLTPDLQPFFAGTYFPKSGAGGYPGFLTLASNIASAWRQQESEVRKSAAEFAQSLDSVLARPIPASRSGIDLFDRAVQAMHHSFDFECGGFGERPKFPPYSALRFLMDFREIRPQLPGDPDDIRQLCSEADHMVHLTLEKMLSGGIRDWVQGGIHRYATDQEWFLPHFEKVTADNAQLVAVLDRVRSQGFGLADEALVDTCDWLIGTMRNPDGTFGVAVDADSEGQEGRFTTWPHAELIDLIGREATRLLQATEGGNYFDEATDAATGRNILLPPPPGELRDEREKLRQVAGSRTHPLIDTKAIASVNGLVISALASAGRHKEATNCAEAWLTYGAENLPHMVQDGESSGRAFLDDIIHLAEGFLDLAESTGEARFRAEAERLIDRELPAFADAQSAGFYYSVEDPLFVYRRTKPVLDSAMPGPNASAVRLLYRLGRVAEATAALSAFLGWADRMPTATETLLSVALSMAREGYLADDAVQSSGVAMSFAWESGHPDPDGWRYGAVTIRIPDGFHINGSRPATAWLTPTELEVVGAYGEVSFLDSDEDRLEGEVHIPIRVRPRLADQIEFAVIVRYQMCSDVACMAPAEETLTARFGTPGS